ncbi:Sedlin [Tilletiaria anomala UBC 951]|uniref:Trafficking protein particle complex subunit 2-like protein n=1 Tax=Tilletiaria anomala (strain ATCC 24038 / CBS 436.72 / UBC 951) TaxID=1037660 RepID=A0A066VU15_TILAU|nr:Sedlin [Tilletiaria anomala UBC 951]KDN43763.1 Sedlin [Tilletiaria anomala UBC 951]
MIDNRIHSIALISPRNSPLYVRNFIGSQTSSSNLNANATAGGEASAASPAPGIDETAVAAAQLKTNYIAHSALDIIEDRTANKQQEQYLGLLMTIEDVAVYGFQTSTKVKIVVMLLLSDQIVRDIDIITIFRAINNAYLAYLSNPFNDSSLSIAKLPRNEALLPANARVIRSRKFDRAMEGVVGLG